MKKLKSPNFPTTFALVSLSLYFGRPEADATQPWPKYQVEYDQQFSLICDNLQLNVTQNAAQFSQLFWVLPSGEQITGLVDTERFSASGTGPDGWNLTIHSVDDPDFGEYMCVLLGSNNNIHTLKLGLNVDGPYFGSLLERYRQRAMIGGIAGGSVMVVTLLLCALHHFRYRDDQDTDDGTPGEVRVHRRSSFTETYEYENPSAVYMEEMREIDPEENNSSDRPKGVDKNVPATKRTMDNTAGDY